MADSFPYCVGGTSGLDSDHHGTTEPVLEPFSLALQLSCCNLNDNHSTGLRFSRLCRIVHTEVGCPFAHNNLGSDTRFIHVVGD